MGAGPKSGIRLVKRQPEELNETLVEKTRVTIKRAWQAWRELEAYKLKHGYCIMGMTCMRKAVEGAQGSKRGCPHHLAATKAGMRLYRKEAYVTEYGRLQQELAEQEKQQRIREAAAEKAAGRRKRPQKRTPVRRKAA